MHRCCAWDSNQAPQDGGHSEQWLPPKCPFLLQLRQNLLSSVTRWLGYLYNICPFVTKKICPVHKKLPKYVQICAQY